MSGSPLPVGAREVQANESNLLKVTRAHCRATLRTQTPNSQPRLFLWPPAWRDEIIRLSSEPLGMWAILGRPGWILPPQQGPHRHPLQDSLTPKHQQITAPVRDPLSSWESGGWIHRPAPTPSQIQVRELNTLDSPSSSTPWDSGIP